MINNIKEKNHHESENRKINDESMIKLLNFNSNDKKIYQNKSIENGKEYNNEVEEEEEENAITELNDVAILSASKISLKKTIKNKNKSFSNIICNNISLKGLFLALLSAVMNSITAIVTKLSTQLSATDIGFIRYLIQFIVMIIILKYKNLNPFGPKNQRKLLLIRAFTGTIGLITFFFGFKLLDPSDCLAITHTSVIITSILARIFLKEKLSFAHLIAVFLTALGVIFIAKPRTLLSTFMGSKLNNSNFNNITIFKNCSLNDSLIKNCTLENIFDNSNYTNDYHKTILTVIGIASALICAFASSTVQVILKKLSTQKVHFSIVIIYVTYVGMPVTFFISLVLVLTGYSHQNFKSNINQLPLQLLYASIGGFFGVISQILLNISLRYEEASKVAILRTLDVFLTFLIQYIFLKIQFDMLSLIGSLSILFGTFLILTFKLIENKISKDKLLNNDKDKCNPIKRFIKFSF